jgi:hypothetical protein
MSESRLTEVRVTRRPTESDLLPSEYLLTIPVEPGTHKFTEIMGRFATGAMYPMDVASSCERQGEIRALDTLVNTTTAKRSKTYEDQA